MRCFTIRVTENCLKYIGVNKYKIKVRKLTNYVSDNMFDSGKGVAFTAILGSVLRTTGISIEVVQISKRSELESLHPCKSAIDVYMYNVCIFVIHIGFHGFVSR